MNEAIEVVIFKAKAGVQDEQLRTAALAVTPILNKDAGIHQPRIRRITGRSVH